MLKEFFTLKWVAATIVAIVFGVPGASAVLAAAPPRNDDFSRATVISGVPFSDSVDITRATTESGEPQPCAFSPQTVWYSFTPSANIVIKADTAGSTISANLNIYQAVGSGFGGLSFLTCSAFSNGSAIFSAQAGVTYYLQAGSTVGGSGKIQVNLQSTPPPPNDNFANATTIGGLPFSDTVDSSGATREANEPTPSCGSQNRTVWYAFTPSVTESISAEANSPFGAIIAAYKGNSLTNLTQVGCNSFRLAFQAEAGVTYFFQVAGDVFFPGSSSLQFNLAVTPPPVASFSFSPFDPSAFDTVQFFNQSFDPGGSSFQSQMWNFGDGATATSFSPTHQYAADGDYTVQLTVTTVDGRTNSTSQVVPVRTHDVAIIKFAVPNAVSAGQTRQIVVGINSKRQPETVQVDLFKSSPNGFQTVGTLTQSVPMRPANQTTDFNFSYTFTADDANVGKVTFKAVATIINARDALPADNEAIAAPTKVNR